MRVHSKLVKSGGGATLLSLLAGYHAVRLVTGKADGTTPAHRKAAFVLLLGTLLISVVAIAALLSVARR